jgi:steroid 5-alpha reductase family enzyme
MTSQILTPVLASLFACCAIMCLVWVWAVSIKNGGVVDIFWSLNFPVIAAILLIIAPGFSTRVYLLCGMIILWGLRLGTHLGFRVIRHLHEEEGRYAQLRKEWAPHADRRLFWFFQAQAVSNVLLAIPFFIVTANTETGLSVFEYAAMILWCISLAGETLADHQLDEFKKDPQNRGKVCDKGLWYYSRHPNYFFEWMIWVSYFVFALGSPLGYIAILSPAIILYLLLNVTGIPATEEQSIRSKGHLYKNYQKTTSAFVPWFKKLNN